MLMFPKIEEPQGLNDFPVLYWNHVGLEMNRLTVSLGGPQGGPTMGSRALGLLHLAMHDAFFGMLGHNAASDPPLYLPSSDLPNLPGNLPRPLGEANAALTAAAITVLETLYVGTSSGISALARLTIEDGLAALVAGFAQPVDKLSIPYVFGARVGRRILDRLAVKVGEPGATQGNYMPKDGPFFFRDEPVNPVKRVPVNPDFPALGTKAARIYHGPLYGTTVATFAVTDEPGHALAPPPKGYPLSPVYVDSLRQVIRLGGAPELPLTTRTPDGTVAALFWAYDGANLIGTPPRLYNQVLRVLAWAKRDDTVGAGNAAQNAEFVRLFALANTAMADAGKLCWKEKYLHEFWRPLTGVREHDTGSGKEPNIPVGNTTLDADADPFWLALGAPNTNTNDVSFKPPFPAYPSGHATFGAACFQMARLFYKARDSESWNDNGPDDVAFSFVSEELNGVSRDLRQDYDPTLPIEDQPGVVRTRVVRRFPSLWHAIFENAFSRIWLGVHWNFDAAAPGDIHEADGTLKDPSGIAYSDVWTGPGGSGSPPTGGVPLGLGLANDIFANAMKAPQGAPAAPAAVEVQRSNTNIR